MKKRFVAGMLAMVMALSLMATTAFAVESETTEIEGKKLYSVTVDAELLATGGSASKSIDASLVLGGMQNGWSSGDLANFSTLPTNARVESVEVYPGRVVASGPVTSAVVVTKCALTSPAGKRVEMSFNKNSMEFMTFYNSVARGNWRLQLYGTNVGQSTGGITYASTTIKIWYTLE